MKVLIGALLLVESASMVNFFIFIALVLKNLSLNELYFDDLFIIGPTGDQYNDIDFDIYFTPDIKDLHKPVELDKEKNLLIFVVVPLKNKINEYFCRGRHNNCNFIYQNQNVHSSDRQVREHLFVPISLSYQL